jgi:hypothetical protein
MPATLLDSFRAALGAGVPLIAIESVDPTQTLAIIVKACNGGRPVIAWDVIRRFRPANPAGQDALAALPQSNSMTPSPVEDLAGLGSLPPRTVIVWYAADNLMTEPTAVQAIWNLRDTFEPTGSCLVLLAPSWRLPAALQNDVLVLTEEYPTADELALAVRSIADDAAGAVKGFKPPTAEQTADYAAILLGLSQFAAKQTLALAVEKTGFNRPKLWDRKCRAVEDTPGLTVYRGSETFEDLGGCENAKRFLRAVLAGNGRPRAIAFWDELEKGLGTGQDTSGVSQDYLGCLLRDMQDSSASGMLLVGPPGCAKSALAKATGNEGGIPLVAFDAGGMKASLVGESERRFREALKRLSAISQNKTLWIATCNATAALPPELRRRFCYGTFFFDLPTAEERDRIWDIYRKALPKGIKCGAADLPDDDNWTGAEIKQCCKIAADLSWPLKEAAAYIVPVARSAADRIQKLREEASGRYLSASYPGVYRFNPAAAPVGRRLNPE